MASSIQPTPVLYGKDAEDILASLAVHCSAEEMARRVDFTELETPAQVWAYLEITESEDPDPDALKIEFAWNAGYRECKNWFSVTKETENGDIEISYHRRTGERITVIDCK